jgi:hypothetical protein
MKKYIVLLLLLSSVVISAQKIERDSIIGKWNVVKIEKSPNNKNFKSVVDGYKKATFHFKKDSTMSLTSKSSNAIYAYILKSVKKSRWILKDSLVLIGNSKNKYSIMKINVSKNKEGTFFNLSENERLPLVLKLEKEKE